MISSINPSFSRSFFEKIEPCIGVPPPWHVDLSPAAERCDEDLSSCCFITSLQVEQTTPPAAWTARRPSVPVSALPMHWPRRFRVSVTFCLVSNKGRDFAIKIHNFGSLRTHFSQPLAATQTRHAAPDYCP